MGVWEGDSTTHLSNRIHGQLTMILVFLHVSLSVFIFDSTPSFSTFLSLIAASAVLAHLFIVRLSQDQFLHSFTIVHDCR